MGLDLLFNQYGGKLYNMSFAYLKSREEAEEVVQDVLLKLWQNRGKIDITGFLEGYLFKMTKNLLLNRIRTKSRKGFYTEELQVDIAGSTRTDQSLLLEDMQVFLSKAILGMPHKRQQIFKMSRMEGLSNKQIAQQLGLSEKTVENQIGRAIKYLRSYMSYT
ncbi:RNA polymerase sigma-70 factor [Reichenbachiella sp. MALMAid0571]|uniref:RNA polymerase sigma-70 factor n=1 Tax=Reichenbachiella sp. MALMAid0571 TaxID=3143939 RepID=UPI0032DFE036